MNNVYLWELKQRRNIILWWCVGSIILSTVIIALYPSIRDQAAQLDKVINSLPPGLRGLKAGTTSGTVNVGDPMQFLNSQLFYATLPIIWIILAITRGSAILGKEETSRTLELLLARPLSRSKLLTAKAAALASELLIVGLATFVAVAIACPIFAIHLPAERLALTTLTTALFSLSFGWIAFALQAASSMSRRIAVAVAVAISFGGYILASLSTLTDWLEKPAKFAPFHYFTPLDVLRGDTPKGLLIYLVGVAVIGAALAYTGFRRRDIE
jgi:ABC-2 type transport system permease protein